MKITTDNLDLELSIEEFETILAKDMLDIMITIIASLSDKIGTTKNCIESDNELTAFLNDIQEDIDGDSFNNTFDDDFCNDGECDKCSHHNDCEEYNLLDRLEDIPDIEGNNETVKRIYYNIFGNGERRSEK